MTEQKTNPKPETPMDGHNSHPMTSQKCQCRRRALSVQPKRRDTHIILETAAQKRRTAVKTTIKHTGMISEQRPNNTQPCLRKIGITLSTLNQVITRRHKTTNPLHKPAYLNKTFTDSVVLYRVETSNTGKKKIDTATVVTA